MHKNFDPYDFSDIDSIIESMIEIENDKQIEMDTFKSNTFTIKSLLSPNEYIQFENILKEFERIWEERHPLSIVLHIRLFRKQLETCDVSSYTEDFISSLLKIPVRRITLSEKQYFFDLSLTAMYLWNKARSASPLLTRVIVL